MPGRISIFAKIGYNRWLGSWKAWRPERPDSFCNSAESGLGFFSFFRKLKKDPENPV
jgi:hypothetical protein